MKNITLALSVLTIATLTACGSSGGGAASSTAKTPNLVAPSPSPAPSPSTVQLTVYTDAAIRTVNATTVTVTGYCAIYQADTYCWDDGWHRAIPSVAIDYWGLALVGGILNLGNEGVAGIGDEVDPLDATPMLITQAFTNLVGGNTIEPNGTEQTMVTELLANGTQSQVTCTIDGQNLDCGTFTLAVQ